MDGPRYDSRRWADTMGDEYVLPPSALPPRVRVQLFDTPAQARAGFHSILLILAAASLPLSVRMVEAGTSGLMIAAPNVAPAAFTIGLAGGLLLLAAVKTSFFPRLIAVCAVLAWPPTLAAAGFLLVTGARDRAAAVGGAPQRAFVVGSEHRGRRRDKTFLQLASGEQVETRGFGGAYGASSRCYLVRRLDGRRGFAWLRVLDASPAPGPGQLSWPVDPAKCFSAVPLSEIGG
jgi:hypothetical protein